MKRNKTITIQKLIIKNMIIAFCGAFFGIVLFLAAAQKVLDSYIMAQYSKSNMNATYYSEAAVPVETLTAQVESRLDDYQLIILTPDLKVVESIGASYVSPPVQYSGTEFASLITEYSESYYPVFQKVINENGAEEIGIVLEGGGGMTSYFSSYNKIINTYYFVVLTGVILIAIGVITTFISSVYRPVKDTMAIIQTNIMKTPYDFSMVNSNDVILEEGKSVLDSYNLMVDNLNTAQIERANAVNANKQLISNLAHDLKSPITILKGYAEVLGTQDLSDEERKEYTSYIYKSSNDLNNLLNLLFEQVKYGNGEAKMDLVKTDINSLLRQSCANYYMLFTNQGFDFTVDIPETECFVKADSLHINRVFSNLLQNILNHNPVPTAVQVESKVENGVCVLRFMDNGVGINKENEEKIFHPFFQEDSSRNKQNSGLGLYVVKQVALGHGGDISLEQDTNYKTVFKLTLPLA